MRFFAVDGQVVISMIKGLRSLYWSALSLWTNTGCQSILFFSIAINIILYILYPPLYSLQLFSSLLLFLGGFSRLPRCCLCSTLLWVLSTSAWIFHCTHSLSIYACALTHWTTLWVHNTSDQDIPSVKRLKWYDIQIHRELDVNLKRCDQNDPDKTWCIYYLMLWGVMPISWSFCLFLLAFLILISTDMEDF